MGSVDIWIASLEQYTFVELCSRPSLESWSLGQLYKHLIADTNYYLEQVRICITSNDHADETASNTALAMFSNDAFPDERIVGHPSNAFITQPESKEQLLQDMLLLKVEFDRLRDSIETTSFHGKAKHPGLKYFNAEQWMQFADMHLRHHLRQKKRIESFLRKDG